MSLTNPQHLCKRLKIHDINEVNFFVLLFLKCKPDLINIHNKSISHNNFEKMTKV